MALIFVNRYFFPDFSATSQMLSDLAMSVAADGKRVRVITSAQRLTDAQARLPSREYVHGVDVLRVWSTRFGRQTLSGRSVDYLTFHCSVCVALLALLRRSDVVVAATDPPLLGLTVSFAAWLRGARVVNWLHDIFPETAMALAVPGLGGRAGRWLCALRDRALRRAACNVVLGDVMAAYVRRRGVAAQAIRTIHNWSDGAAIAPIAHSANALRQRWNLQDKWVVGYSGNIGRAHDLGVLPQVAARFSGSPDVVFLIIGDGAGLKALREESERLGLSNVVFQPYQPRAMLAFSLAAIDVHLISLRPELEGFIVPSKLYGVLAAGRASVFMGDANGEVARVLRGHDAGVVCANDDADALFGVLSRLHDDRASGNDMARRARDAFDKQFDQAQALARWRHLLDELTEPPN